MILLFSSSDFPSESAAKLSQQLRADGFLLCLPHKVLPLERLSAVPFSAAVLCMEHKTDGLPPVTELRTLFPKIRLLVLSQSNPSYRWRSIPNTDAELSSPYSFTEISTMLENLGAFRCHAKNAIRRYGIELPANRQNALLGVCRTSLTPAQHTILRLLLMCGKPLNEEVIAGFLRAPHGTLPTESVRVHIHNLNKVAANGSIPRLIHYAHRTGYCLCSPYGEFLSEQ